MKKLLILLLACMVLLCGCGQDARDETTIPTEPSTEPPTEPAGLYDPESALELRTKGGVRVYPLDFTDAYAIAAVGEDLVVFSGTETTTLTLLRGENRYIAAKMTLDCYISPEQNATQVTNRGVSYFSQATGEVVLLDGELKEVARIQLPGTLVGTPVLNATRQAVYYCTPESIRVLDLENGISRLLKQIAYPVQTAEGLLLEDGILRCGLTDEDGREITMFLSTQTGAIVVQWEGDLKVATYNGHYYSTLPDGILPAQVYGLVDQEPRMLIPADAMAEARYLPNIHSMVTESVSGGVVSLDIYELNSGFRRSSLTLEAGQSCAGAASTGDGVVYLLVSGAEGSFVYGWDPAKLALNDGTVYTSPRYTRENPDTEGLKECQVYADEIGQRYGLEILLGEEAAGVYNWEYEFQPEYQVPVIMQELKKLDGLLSIYPENFLGVVAESTKSGVLRICLVRSAEPKPETGRKDIEPGLQFWVNESPYAALVAGSIDEHTLYHTLFHAIETKVYSDSQIYYEWDKLNPKKFTYDYDYDSWQARESTKYLTDKDRAFIDSYSMSFPAEDRARIMEYAMTEGNESYFQTETMQEKLYQLCLGIRKAFGLTKSEETYPWEQYLTESLAYVPKKK